jgi:hypothetical protein
MPYVQRDSSDRIVGIYVEARDDVQEWVDADSPEMQTFVLGLKGKGESDALYKLVESDQAMIRVLEDLVDTLISHNLLHFTDLPDAAQAKMLTRRSLRCSVNALHLFRDDDQKLI